MTHQLERVTVIPRARAEVFEFFADARNLEKLTPPFLRFRILTPGPIPMAAGTRIDYSIRLNGIPMRWKTLIEEYVENEHFIDLQLSGPYRLWRHLHRFRDTDQGTEMYDRVDYQLPFGPLGEIAHAVFVRRQLDTIFNYRAQVMAECFPRSG